MVEKVKKGRYVGLDNVLIEKERNRGGDEEGFIGAERNVKIEEKRTRQRVNGQEKGGWRCGCES